MLPVVGLFLPDRCLHDAEDLFCFSVRERSRRPLFPQAELGRFWNHMEMDMHHFLSGTSAVVLNDVAFLNSRRSASSAGDTRKHPANAGGGFFTEIHHGCLGLFGNHQSMPRGQGVDVQERQRQIVFVDAVAGDGSIDNAAED